MEHHAETPASRSNDFADEIDPTHLARRIEQLRGSQPRLARRSLGSILTSIEKVVQEWLRPHSTWRREAEKFLPSATGFSVEMIRRALPLQIEPLRAPNLRKLLDDEIGCGDGRPLGTPDVIAHVLPGNLAGLAAIPVALSLSLKSAVLVKAASGDRIFPSLWAKSIGEVDPELGACIATCYWRGGDRSCEAVAFDAADLVVASGDDASVEDARTRCRARFIGHGHRVSFALVTREVLADALRSKEAANALAFDVALWDQRGCLSPQVCFIEGTFDEAHRFANPLAGAFAHHARLLPPRQLTVEEQLAVRRFRDEAEWENIGGRRRDLFVSDGTLDWSIVIEADPIFRPTPLCRSLRLLPLSDVAEIPAALRPVRSFLQAAGVDCPASRTEEIKELLVQAEVPHLSQLGTMQMPPLSWRQGGRPRVADWVDRR